MKQADTLRQWESAAPGWARWEATIAAWVEPATREMLDMAGVGTGARVLDLACGAGSQTLEAARRVGAQGHIVASDISETMLRHTQDNARAAGLANITTLAGAAEELALEPESFDAAICRLGLMLFAAPAEALAAVHHALRPGGKFAAVVFTTPAANPFMAQTMQILLRHADRKPPQPGQPGIFALGAPGQLARMLVDTGFVDVAERVKSLSLSMTSTAQALTMMQEAFGAYRAVVSACSSEAQAAAWNAVGEFLRTLETKAGLITSAEVVVAAGTKAR